MLFIEVDLLLNLFLPNEYVKDIFEIDPYQLKEKGIKGIITDLDNTLVAWDVALATEEVAMWFNDIQKAEINIIIISNNNEDRVSKFSAPLEMPYIHSARKPLRRSFNKAAEQMNLKPNEIAVVGDQLLTDVLGGNRGGFYTILVVPIVETDAPITKFNRFIERRILNYFRKKGKINGVK